MSASMTDSPKGAYEGSEPSRPQYKNKFLSVCSFILVMEFCERLAFYTFQTNLAIFIQKNLGISTAKSSIITGLFGTFVYVTPLIGAYMADAVWGRYKTIMYFSALYIIGLYLIAISSLPSILSSVVFFIALFLFICVGAGGIKSNVVTMGADQYDPLTEKKQMESFFNWFYWMINVGSLIATMVIANFALNGGLGISSRDSFAASFFFAAIMFTIALAVFMAGKRRYYLAPADSSAFATFMSIVVFAAKTSAAGKSLLSGFVLLLLGIVINILLVFLNGAIHDVISYVNGVVIFIGIVLCIAFGRNVDWIEAARPANGGRWTEAEVDGAWELLRLFPYLGFQISFWVVYNCMGGPWALQGCQMDTFVFSSSSQYNPGSWSFWDTVSIIVLIPVFDRVIYPFFGKIQGRSSPTALQKMGAGYAIVIVCMVISGIVEILRRNSGPLYKDGQMVQSICADQDGGEVTRPLNKLSLWWQAPQYALLGIGEILASITAYDLFYNEVPDNMKSACQGLNLLTTALGSTVNTVLQNIFITYCPDDLNKGHQEYLYFAAAALGVLTLVFFMIVSRGFVYKTYSQGDDDDEFRKSSYQRSIEARSSIIG